MADPAQSFEEAFGIGVMEALAAKEAVLRELGTQRDRVAGLILSSNAPGTAATIRNTLVGQWMNMLSDAGRALLVLFHRDQPQLIETLDKLLENLLADPIVFRRRHDWCLFFAARDASATFQLTHCQSPTSESHLTGMLLSALTEKCERWSGHVLQALLRSGGALTLQRIDLSILGGEQATGGDFGLVLELDEDIVPLVFQAKRYERPTADVSQYHHTRGFQHALLSQTKCASAYIFYENGRDHIPTPLPPLVKSVESVVEPNRTNVLQDSMDLATYLLTAFNDREIAPRATSPDEGLRMIYSEAEPGQLSALAVISSDGGAAHRYQAILAQLAPEILGDEGQEHVEQWNGSKP